MSNPKVTIFGENKTAFADYIGESTSWQTNDLKTGRALDLNPDSKRSTIIYEEIDTDDVGEISIGTLLPTGFSIQDIKEISSIQIDNITGDVYVLQKSVDTPGNDSFWGGALYRQKKSEIQKTALVIEDNLFNPQDMKIDSQRRKLWIADTGNHRLICLNIDTLETIKIYEFDNLVSCCGIAINSSNGALISRWFNTDLEEVILHIKNDITSHYSSFSDFPWGDFSSTENEGDLLALESGGNKKGVYRISSTIKRLEIPSNNRIPAAISEDPICGTVSVLYADGSLEGYSNKLERFGQESFPPDSKNILFPCSYGISHWVGNYKKSKRAYLPTSIRIGPYTKKIIKALPVTDLGAGVCNFVEQRPTF
jgi:hypothetical protein